MTSNFEQTASHHNLPQDPQCPVPLTETQLKDPNETKRFENVPYLDLLSETQRILVEQIGHCQITIQEIEKEFTNSKLPQLQECITQHLD